MKERGNRVVELLNSENLVLNQINNNILEINNAIVKLMKKMGLSEWTSAFRQDDDGNFRMQAEYDGFFKNVVYVYEDRMKRLLIQKREKIEEIRNYQSLLAQKNAKVQKNELERVYVDLPRETVQEREGMNSSAMYDHNYMPDFQYTQSNTVCEEEHTQGKTL